MGQICSGVSRPCGAVGSSSPLMLLDPGDLPGEAIPLLARIQVMPYGVLGLQLTNFRQEKRMAPLPDDATAIVDAAGLHHIRDKGPCGASGSAGAIYKHLGIQKMRSFSSDVVHAIRAEGDAKLHSYGNDHVIHAIGPDFRREPYCTGNAEQGLEALAKAYSNILQEFAAPRLPPATPFRHLRLLPLSSGIFSGNYGQSLPGTTMRALGAGFAMIDTGARQRVLDARTLELCIFSEAEYERYAVALRRVQRGPGVAGDSFKGP